MNWTAVLSTGLATVLAVGLGALTNELCEISPWLATRILRRAARREARDKDEAELLFVELEALLCEVPGKLSKLIWAIGRGLYAFGTFKRRRLNFWVWLHNFLSVVQLGSIGVMIWVLVPEIRLAIAESDSGAWWMLGAGLVWFFLAIGILWREVKRERFWLRSK